MALCDNRTFRISLNVFCGAFMTWVYAAVMLHMVRTAPVNITMLWVPFFLVLFVWTWAEVCLASSSPDPYLTKQKKMARIVLGTLLFLAGSLSVGGMLIVTSPKEAMQALGWFLISVGYVPVPWMIYKIDPASQGDGH